MIESDFEFSFKLKKAAMGPYIEEKWGWDDDFQRQFHTDHFTQRRFKFISIDDQDVGSFWFERFSDHWRFGEFYILPEFQNKGIGTHILSSAIVEADKSRLPIRLEYLKWNKVGSLYNKLGFKIISENEIHYFLERKVKNS